jgi:hypothetical protein
MLIHPNDYENEVEESRLHAQALRLGYRLIPMPRRYVLVGLDGDVAIPPLSESQDHDRLTKMEAELTLEEVAEWLRTEPPPPEGKD